MLDLETMSREALIREVRSLGHEVGRLRNLIAETDATRPLPASPEIAKLKKRIAELESRRVAEAVQ